jgi:hypothetical protein
MEKMMNDKDFDKYFDKIYKEEQTNFIVEKISKLDEDEKEFVFEYIKMVNPDTSKLIKEDKWYNWVGDVLGIVDPTGIINILNGLSYLKQGDKFLGIVSLVAGIPIIGKAVGLPLLGALKSGSRIGKLLRGATTSADFAKIGKSSSLFGKFLGFMPKISQWFGKMVPKLPKAKLLGKTINSMVGSEGVLTKAASEMKSIPSATPALTPALAPIEKSAVTSLTGGGDFVTSLMNFFK